MRQEAVALFLSYLLLYACGGVEAGKEPRRREGRGIKTRRVSDPGGESQNPWFRDGKGSHDGQLRVAVARVPDSNAPMSIPPSHPKATLCQFCALHRAFGEVSSLQGGSPKWKARGGLEHQAQRREPRSPLHFVPSP